MDELNQFYTAELPEFPLEALPINMFQFVEAVAKNVQVSPDMVAVPLLSTLCIPLQNRFQVRVDSSYAEPLCLYTLTIARPSERKSAIIRILEKPFWEYQSKINAEREGLNVKPMALYATDVTPEKLAQLMVENDGAMALLSDEPDALAVAAGLRYGKSKNLGLMLQAWSAGRVMIQRAVDDRRISINRAVMSVSVMSQPSFIASLMQDKEMSSRGFMQRFLYAQPLSKVGERSFFKPEIPEILLDEYSKMIKTFLSLDTDTLRDIRLSKGAQNYADITFAEIEKEIEQDSALEGWMGKSFGQFLRIAGILHCAFYGTEAAEHEIDWNIMVAASKIIKYFTAHARVIFSEYNAPEEVVFARDLYRKLRIKRITTFTKSDLQKVIGTRTEKQLVHSALILLVRGGYLGCIAKGETVEDKVEAKGAEFSVPRTIEENASGKEIEEKPFLF